MPWIAPTIATVTVLSLLGGAFAMSSGTGSNYSCGNGTISTAAVAKYDEPVAGFEADALVNAATIMNSATAAGVKPRDQVIGVMTAITESDLQILDHSTDPGGAELGLFQQDETWGEAGDRLDPTASSAFFFTALKVVPERADLTPEEAAAAAQRDPDPDRFADNYDAAVTIVKTLTSIAGGGGCAVSGDAQELAQTLVNAADEGRIRGLIPDHIREIRWIAHGEAVPDCTVDVRILQVLVLALEKFRTIGVGDINRKCTGQQAGAGTESSHWINGGGGAVDLYALGGQNLTGADGQSLRLISMLDPVMPMGARIGQADCRAAAGVAVATTNFTQYDDFCTHLHIDVAFTDEPLSLSSPAA